MPDKITLYRDASGEFRWTRQAGNNEITGQSSEGYTDKDSARDNITSTQGGEFTLIDNTAVEETE